MSKEIRARVERTTFQTHMNATEVTLSLSGVHEFERGEIVVVTLPKIPEITRKFGRIEAAPEVLATRSEA